MRRFLAFFIGILGFSSFAQGEANNWYFGINAGITFNTNPPSALTDGQLSTNEGCSSISDPNGNLLMYTDGRTIWNRNHQIMPNADYFGGTGLNGDPSSTSSGLIVPHPTNPDLYFVFTIDEPHHENAYAYPNQGPANSSGASIPFYTDTGNGIPQDDDGFNNGLNYSIVDISLDGGLGDVITGERNNELITYDTDDSEEIKFKASEKITAVRGRDCNSVWVITHFRNTFYAFFIDTDGIDEVPVTSTVPPLLEISNYRRAALGYLKASPNADKLLIAHNTTNFDPEQGSTDDGDGNVYTYDFDNLTGLVTNPVELISNVNAYGVEFSQDGTKAYATVGRGSSVINQWDLNSDDIQNSIETIANIGNVNTALQLGPDGKIYHSIFGESKLGVINNPDEQANSVDYTQSELNGALSLNGRFATFGLPPFIQSLFSKRIPIVDTTEEEVIEQVALCDTYTYTLSYENISGATYTWSRNGEVLTGETDFFLDINVDETADFPIRENYKLEVDLNTGECPLIGIAEVIFNQSPAYTNGELKACTSAEENAVFDLTQIGTILAQQAEAGIDEIEVSLYRNQQDAESGENPVPYSNDFENLEGLDSIFVMVTTFGVCSDLLEFSLVEQEFPDLDLQTEIVPYCVENFPDPILLNALDPGEDPTLYEFLWSTGENGASIETNELGEYTVSISFVDENCKVTKTFEVEESEPTFESRSILLCDTFQYTIENNDYTEGSFTWLKNGVILSGETNPTLIINLPQDNEFPISDIYTLEIDLEDGSCLKTKAYAITFNESPAYNPVELTTCIDFELGYGVFNLESSIEPLIEGLNQISEEDLNVLFYETQEDAFSGQNEIQNPQNFENLNSYNEIFAVVQSFESCETIVNIQLNTFDFPDVIFEDDLYIFCLEDFPEPITLQATINQNSLNLYEFLWSTSETSSTIEVNQAGTYTVEISNPETGCSFTKSIEVRASTIASFDHKIERNNNRSSLELIVDPSSLGEYEFAIEDPADFQDSPVFENLSPGIYTVYVRDQLGCGISEKTIGVLGIMKFFTPNGDGINDVWEISGLLNTNEEDILLQVYDRFGKLLKSFTNRDRGWDGTYNGKNMPTDDYWYRVRLTDGTVETGNFTLKR